MRTPVMKVAVRAVLLSVLLISSSSSCSQTSPAEREFGPPTGTDRWQDRVELTGLDELAKMTAECREARPFATTERKGSTAARDKAGESSSRILNRCVRVIYVLSSVMPLSEIGVDNIVTATNGLKVPLSVVDGETLEEWVGDSAQLQGDVNATRALVGELVGAGASLHYPSILVYGAQGRLVGPAILGFKTADAYEQIIAERLDQRRKLAEQNMGAGHSTSSGKQDSNSPQATAQMTVVDLAEDLASTAVERAVRDLEVDGRPGAYFRHLPNTNWIGFEAGRQNHFLRLDDGVRLLAPGITDLVPSPDGLYLVTLSRIRGGIEFYDAGSVVAESMAVVTPRSPEFVPFYVDIEMVDQYPSVGMLKKKEHATVYRVLTSWHDGVAHRDYEIQHFGPDGRATAHPLGGPIRTCANYQLSTPILAKDGREVAARDEATGTTKIFRIDDDSTCVQVLDTGMQTGKVAWDSTGRRIAFAVPRGLIRSREGDVEEVENLHGVFVLDRRDLTLMRVPGSTAVDRLTFPEFVGDATVIFLIRRRESRERDRFHFFCCLK